MNTSYNRRSGGAGLKSRQARGGTPQRGYRGGSRGTGVQRPQARRTSTIHHSRFIRKAEVAQQVEAPVPAYHFEELPVDTELKAAIAKRGYVSPTPIQEAVIPQILLGRDIVGIANTGTGKTGAFLIPLLQKVRSKRGETVLIVAPTRELAIQIDTELRELSRGMRVYSVVCVGGTGIGPQLRALRAHNAFVIGTPGRLKDLVNRGVLDLARVESVVLDEADRMLDMGFIADMRYLLSRMPTKRQTLFFSATLSPDIERIIGEFLHNPVSVSVKTADTSHMVDQDVVHIRRDEDKVDVLCKLLADHTLDKVIVFGRTKHGVEKLSQKLIERGIQAVSIHGNKQHTQRQRALQAFRDGSVRVLVATDVAARGLDIPRVSHVINFDVPTTYDDYVHRIGRTGRAGKTGIALTFVEGAASR